MTLERVLEPEVMDTADEANDYDAMNHAVVNSVFVVDLLGAVDNLEGKSLADDSPAPHLGILDLGTGTAQIPIELCRQHDTCRVMALDMAVHMLDLAQLNVEAAGLISRISLRQIDAKAMPLDDGLFDVVMSNSIIHHIPDPRQVIAESWRVLRPGGVLFFRDLLRPQDDGTVKQLVASYAGDENEHSQQMFEDSLRAALSIEELTAMVTPFDPQPNIQATTDRHWTWIATKPDA